MTTNDKPSVGQLLQFPRSGWQATLKKLMRYLDHKGDTGGVALLSTAISEYLESYEPPKNGAKP